MLLSIAAGAGGAKLFSTTGLQIAALLLSGLLSGVVATWRANRQAKKLVPAQNRDLEANAVKSAVETVEAALEVARERIQTLERQVLKMTTQVGELTGRLEAATANHQQIKQELDLTLVERARLQYQLGELSARLSARRLDELMRVAPPDAIVMVRLDNGTITYASEGIFSLLGYLPHELIGGPLERLVPENFRDLHRKQREEYRSSPRTRLMGMGNVLGLEAMRADGAKIAVEISLHPTGDGRVLALLKARDQPSASGSGSTATGSEAGEPATKTE